MTTLLDRRKNAHAQPLFGVDVHDVTAPNRPADRALYAVRQKVYPKLTHGLFRSIKWIVMAVTLGIYYALPWLRWPRGADLPNQAVLLDMEHNRFFFFFLEIWPQEFYFVTGLLVLAALALFLATSLSGRVWCGYACPQTVWTDLMVTVERIWQGDRNARIRLDKEAWSLRKLFLKGMTHVSWLAIGVATGGALVFYFRDAPTLAQELVTGTAPTIAYLFLGIFSFITYLLGGIAREQVCIYMCPWPRIQGAMTDRHTLLVSYNTSRGEPRGALRKSADGKPDWSNRGDCIDCKACVAVCPTGIDIRDGSQLECIQCALCVDACNAIMDRVGRPRGLIDYDTIARTEARAATATTVHSGYKPLRPRTVLYAVLFALVSGIMLFAWLNRSVLEVNVLPDRTPPFVLLSDGSIRNRYTVKILNKQHEPRTVTLRARDLEGARVTILGNAGEAATVRVATDALREIKVFVTLPPDRLLPSTETSRRFALVVQDTGSGAETQRVTHFQAPISKQNRAP